MQQLLSSHKTNTSHCMHSLLVHYTYIPCISFQGTYRYIDVLQAAVCICRRHLCTLTTPTQEHVCEDSASFDLTSTDLAHCVADLDHILQAKKEELDQEDGEGASFSCLPHVYMYNPSQAFTGESIRVMRQ